MQRDDVLQRLEPMTRTQVRTIDHGPHTRFNVTPEMIEIRPGNRQHALTLSKEGVTSLTKYAGLNEATAKKLSPRTLNSVLSELMDRKGRYSLLLQDNLVVAFSNPTEYSSVNPSRVLTAIERGIKGVDYHRVLTLDNFVVSLEIVGDRRESVAVGDLVQAGANVTFSPLGTVNPTVRSFALRLFCTNGAVHTEVLREYRYGGGGGGGDEGGNGGGDIWNWFRQSAREAYNSLPNVVNRYRVLLNEGIEPDQRASMLEALLRESRISGADADAVRALALERPPENSYDMMNLLTYATSHVFENVHHVRRAQLAIADYTSAEEHARVCPVCHQARRGRASQN
jgi:hypothetical protein